MIQQLVQGSQIEDLSKCGVYCIFHQDKPERLYVGSTITEKSAKLSHRGFYRRFYLHLRDLKRGKHHSKYLQNTVNKYGMEGITFRILEICDTDIRMREQYYIDLLKPVYNAFDTVHPKGRVWTYEHRQKQRSRMMGKPLSSSVYEKIKVPVYQYSKTGELINNYPSIQAAAEDLSIDRASISKCAYGKRPTAGGFVWTLKLNDHGDNRS